MRAAWGCAVGIAAAVLGGCLFPSFDDLNGTGAAPSTTSDGGSSSGGKSSSSSSSGASSSSSSSSGSVADAGQADTGPIQRNTTIPCGSQTCNLATDHCCDEGTSATCKPITVGCNIWSFECMGSQDCAVGESCCQTSTLKISCQAGSCGGERTMCRPEAPLCPAGETCQNFVGPPSVDAHACE